MIVAVTALAASIVTVHVFAVPVQAPLQPAKAPLPLIFTVNVTVPPLANGAVQILPQLIPAGVLVIVPLPVPVLVTVSANVGIAAVTVKGNAPDAAPPGLSTETWAVPGAAMSAAAMVALN